jgi:hypothetical protein
VLTSCVGPSISLFSPIFLSLFCLFSHLHVFCALILSSTAAAAHLLPTDEPVSLSRSVLKHLLSQLLGPVPGSTKSVPSVVLDAVSEVARLAMEDVVREAMVVREEQQEGKYSARAKLLRSLSTGNAAASAAAAAAVASHAHGHAAASEGALTPSMLREAYRRLSNLGRLPTRMQPLSSATAVAGRAGPVPTTLRGIGAAMEEEGNASASRLKKQRAWRR